MKTKFFGKGKLWLAVLITLCAVVSACAVLACITLFNKLDNAQQTANENTTTQIKAPEINTITTSVSNDILDLEPEVSASDDTIALGDSVSFYIDNWDVFTKYGFYQTPRWCASGCGIQFDYQEGGLSLDLTPTKTGELWVWCDVKITDSNDNVLGTSSDGNNAKVKVKIRITPSISYGTVAFGSDSGTPTVNGNLGGGTKRFSVTNGTGSATINSSTGVLKPQGVGKVTVNVFIYETTDYVAGSASVTVTIIKGNQTFSISPSGTSTINYGSTLKLSTTGAWYGGAAWESSNINIASVDSYGNVEARGVGTATITLTADGNANYNAGSATKTIIVVKAPQTPTITPSGTSSITYGSTLQLTGSGQGSLSWKSSNTSVATVSSSGLVEAKGVGSATITLTAAGNSNYNSGTATKPINVTAKNASSLTVSTISNQTYTGSPITPAVTVKDGTKTLTKDKDYTVSYSNNTNAGTANVTVTGKGNYTGTAPAANFIIDKATPTGLSAQVATGTYLSGAALSTVSVTASNNSGLNGSFGWTDPSAKLVEGSANYEYKFTPTDTTNYNTVTWQLTVYAVGYDDLEVEGGKDTYKAYESYSTVGLKVYAVASGVRREVSGYTISIPYEEDERTSFLVKDNGCEVTISYTEGDITRTFSITITVTKADYDMTGVTFEGDSVTYDGNPHTLTMPTNLPQKVTFNKLTIYKGEEEVESAINAGTYTVKALFTIEDEENYNVPELSATLTINKALATIDVSGVVTEYTYNGKEQTVVIEGVASVDNDEQEISHTDNTFTTVAEGNALKITVSVAESDNYEYAEVEITLTVNKATPTLDVSGVETKYTYTGEEQEVNSGATVDNDEQEISYTNNTFTTVEEGNGLKVTVSVEESDNYLGDSKEVTITVKNGSVGKITFENAEVTYDGKTHSIAIKGDLPDEVKVEYYVTGLSSKFTGATDVKIVGGVVTGYEVTAKFSCESGNYDVPDDMNAVLTIKQKEITEDDVSGIKTTYEYSGEDQTPTPVVKLVLTDGGEEVTLSSSKDYQVKYSDDKLNAGTTVQVEVKGAGNYSGTITKSFEITKKTLEVAFAGETGKFVYTGSEQGVSAQLNGIVTNDIGKVIPKITYEGRGATVYGPTAGKPTEAGYYSISVELGGEYTNYESFEVQVRNFQIEQAELEVEIDWDGYDPDNDVLYVGGALPDIKLISATFKGKPVVGTLSWVSQSLSDKLTDTYTWQFVPNGEDDLRNLKTYEGTVSLNAQNVPIDSLEVEFLPDAPKEIYVTTTLDAIKNYIKVTAHYKNGESGEIKGYSLTSDKFTDVPSTADIYQLTIDYNGASCSLEVDYKAVKVEKITVTARDPEAGIKTAYKGYNEFDRTSVIVTAERNDGYVWELSDSEYTVEYVTDNDFFCVGDTRVTISYGEGTDKKSEQISVTVARNDFDLTGISFEDDSVTYDGTVHKAAIVGEFPNGTISYQYYKNGGLENADQGVTDAGEYEVWAVFTFTDATDKKNYNPVTLKKKFTVEKAVYDNVKFENVTADYKLGESLGGLVKVEGLPEGEEVKLTYTVTNKSTGETLSSLDEIKNAGTYEISVKFTVDGNHVPLNDKKATVVVNKLKPQVDPKWRGSLTQGTELSKVLLEAGENEVAGTYQWKTENYELQVGLNRCSYVFTPDDTTNYEVVTSYMDLTVVGAASEAQPTGGGTISTWLIVLIIIAIFICLIVAIIALLIALKRPKTEDSDGFYEEATENDLTA